MGLFSRKKKVTSTPSPASSTSSRLPSPPLPVVESLPVEPPITLSVLLDGWTEGSSVQCFDLQISKDADTTALRSALALKLGDVSMSLFKVSSSSTYDIHCGFRILTFYRSVSQCKPPNKHGHIPNDTSSPSTSSRHSPLSTSMTQSN